MIGDVTSAEEYRGSTTGIRRFFYVASFLVFAAGVPLFLGSTQTARYFAWTIKSPLTAAFLGANYWAAIVLEVLAARQRMWARVRVAFVPVLVFTFDTLVVTLVHLDRFHLHGGAFVTRLSTWLWLAIYIAVPPAMIVLGARQLRRSLGFDDASCFGPKRLVTLPHSGSSGIAVAGLARGDRIALGARARRNLDWCRRGRQSRVGRRASR